jgi:primosomal protein N' (replication factor Y)
MEQVSGRAGRKFKRGTVVIQTHNAAHPVIQHVVNHDYSGMLEILLEERRKFHYPPYYRLILIKLKYSESHLLDQAAIALARELKHEFGNKVLGPEYPLVSKISNLYIKHILVKIERTAKLQDEKERLSQILRQFSKIKDYSKVRIIVDVDPQ